MAQKSTTILASKNHKPDIGAATDIGFLASAGPEYKIYATATSLGNLAKFDVITVSGSTSNNSTFTVKSVASNGLSIIVEEIIATEAVGDSVTIDHVGFVSDKFKGDGYYSQPDGVHTVSYQISSTLANTTDAVIKMQGSLTTAPTENDWFNISGTDFTTDGTTISATKNISFNFTGNLVWLRAKATGITASAINYILLNH